jgi:ATP-binding cassette, subfamily C, bacterial LapB
MSETSFNATNNAKPSESFHYAAPERDAQKVVTRVEVSDSWTGEAIKEPKLQGSVILSSLIINFAALATPLVILQIYDRIIPNQSKSTLIYMIIGVIGIALLDLSLKILRSWQLSYSSTQYMHKMSVEAVRRILYAPHGMVEKSSLSAQMNRFNALLSVAEFHGGQSRTTAIDMPFVVIFLSLMALVGGPLVLVPVVLFAIFGLASIARNKAMNATLSERVNQDNRKYDFIIEVLSGIYTVKALGLEGAMQRRYERLQQGSAENTNQLVRNGNHIQDYSVMFGSIAQISVVAVGAIMTIQGSLSLGALACCTLLSGQILQPLLRGIVVWTDYQNLALRRHDAQMLFDLPAPAIDETKEVIKGDVKLTNVTVLNPQNGENQLNDVSLTMDFGKIVGVFTPPNSSSRALARLLIGDIMPNKGLAKIDESSIYNEMGEWETRPVVLVNTETQMFKGTLLENITLFEVGKKRKAAFEAVKLLGLEDEINQLPEGYETRMNDGQVAEFSAGFVLKIAIARALVASPTVLILDQVTDKLDNQSLMQLSRLFDVLRGRMSVLFTTQNQAILRSADQIYSLQNGILRSAKLAEPGQQATQTQASA